MFGFFFHPGPVRNFAEAKKADAGALPALLRRHAGRRRLPRALRLRGAASCRSPTGRRDIEATLEAAAPAPCAARLARIEGDGGAWLGCAAFRPGPPVDGRAATQNGSRSALPPGRRLPGRARGGLRDPDRRGNRVLGRQPLRHLALGAAGRLRDRVRLLRAAPHAAWDGSCRSEASRRRAERPAGDEAVSSMKIDPIERTNLALSRGRGRRLLVAACRRAFALEPRVRRAARGRELPRPAPLGASSCSAAIRRRRRLAGPLRAALRAARDRDRRGARASARIRVGLLRRALADHAGRDASRPGARGRRSIRARRRWRPTTRAGSAGTLAARASASRVGRGLSARCCSSRSST